MARIGTSRDKAKAPAPPRASMGVNEPVWLALGLGGLVTAIAAPDTAAWMVQPAAIVVSGVGFYGLGRAHGQARPDPAARSRVTYLERALAQLALVAGYDGLARRADSEGNGASGTEPRADAPAEQRERSKPSGGRPGTTAAAIGLEEQGGVG